MGWTKAGQAHVIKGEGTVSNHGILHAIGHCLNPCGIAVNFIEYHLVLISSTGALGGLACLVDKNCRFDAVHFDDDIMLFCNVISFSNLSSLSSSLAGSYNLTERTPCCWLRICPYCASLDLGKYLLMFLCR